MLWIFLLLQWKNPITLMFHADRDLDTVIEYLTHVYAYRGKKS